MPPRPTHGSRGGGGRGGPAPSASPARGAGVARGGGRGGGRGGFVGGAPTPSLAPPPSSVKAIGVMRKAFGTRGRAIKVKVNAVSMILPDLTIFHYDVAMERKYRAKFNMELIETMRTSNPAIFLTAPSYDGQKNLFTVDRYDFPNNTKTFDVLVDTRVYKITLTRARVIDTATLQRYIAREQSWDENVSTAIAALNVAIRMSPNLNHTFRGKSFYSTDNRRPVGQGLEAVRGYFQSIRPTLNRLIINVDISTGVTYRAGSLIDLCLDHFGVLGSNSNPLHYLNSVGNAAIPDVQRIRLQRFLSGANIESRSLSGRMQRYTIFKLTRAGANNLHFTPTNGAPTTVAAYFAAASQPLRFKDLICVETRKGMYLPLERCHVPPGQLSRAELTPDAQRLVVEFATQKPAERVQQIRAGMLLFGYGQSEYVRAFGMNIDEASLPLTINARVLEPPNLQYKVDNSIRGITPRDGAWNMAGKRFIDPRIIDWWIIVVFVQDRVFPMPAATQMKNDFITNCRAVGMAVRDTEPLIKYINPRGDIGKGIRDAGGQYAQARQNHHPAFILCVVPDRNNMDIYRQIKFLGDMRIGVATQCVKSSHATKSKPQYWANVLLKVNVKLGGINAIPAEKNTVLIDAAYPTIIMGADVTHAAPGSDTPSYAAIVGSVDSNQSKYVARTRIQLGRQEMISNLDIMTTEILKQNISYRAQVEKKSQPLRRLIFFRDGVSEGEFQRVLELELPLLQQACKVVNIKPQITFVIVGKRHHIRFFPMSDQEGDRSKNAVAGTVVDQDITNPLEYDFYLQSHGGLLGTSRSAHYTVVHDENGFGPDQMQGMAYTLCHTYARATRSVSIPAPVYYAHIVCSRSKTHYDPNQSTAPTVISSSGPTDKTVVLEAHRKDYSPVNASQKDRMYFM